MKLSKLLNKISHHLSIDKRLVLFPQAHIFPYCYRIKDDVFVKYTASDPEIKKYAYTKEKILIQVHFPKEQYSKPLCYSKPLWYTVSPFKLKKNKKSIVFFWENVKAPYTFFERLHWDGTNMKPLGKKERSSGQIVFEGRILSLSKPDTRNLNDDVSFADGEYIIGIHNYGKQENRYVSEYLYAIRDLGSRYRIEIGTYTIEVAMSDFYKLCLHFMNKEKNPAFLKGFVPNCYKDIQICIIHRIIYMDIPEQELLNRLIPVAAYETLTRSPK